MKRPTQTDAVVGDNIRALRLSHGLSQTALADKLGITFQQVQKYEKGTNRVGSGRLHQIAEILGVPVQVLFEGAASSGKGKSPAHLIAKRDAMRLVEAFAKVNGRQLRMAIVDVVEAIAARSNKWKRGS